jgi:hypothetical protein
MYDAVRTLGVDEAGKVSGLRGDPGLVLGHERLEVFDRLRTRLFGEARVVQLVPVEGLSKFVPFHGDS